MGSPFYILKIIHSFPIIPRERERERERKRETIHTSSFCLVKDIANRISKKKHRILTVCKEFSEIWLLILLKLFYKNSLFSPSIQNETKNVEIVYKQLDKNVHRFTLSAIRGKLLKRKREGERDSFGILYTGYLLSIVKKKIKREVERERENKEIERKNKKRKKRKRERKREKERERKKEKEREREIEREKERDLIRLG